MPPTPTSALARQIAEEMRATGERLRQITDRLSATRERLRQAVETAHRESTRVRVAADAMRAQTPQNTAPAHPPTPAASRRDPPHSAVDGPPPLPGEVPP
jgi:hypothetical protein